MQNDHILAIGHYNIRAAVQPRTLSRLRTPSYMPWPPTTATSNHRPFSDDDRPSQPRCKCNCSCGLISNSLSSSVCCGRLGGVDGPATKLGARSENHPTIAELARRRFNCNDLRLSLNPGKRN